MDGDGVEGGSLTVSTQLNLISAENLDELHRVTGACGGRSELPQNCLFQARSAIENGFFRFCQNDNLVKVSQAWNKLGTT